MITSSVPFFSRVRAVDVGVAGQVGVGELGALRLPVVPEV